VNEPFKQGGEGTKGAFAADDLMHPLLGKDYLPGNELLFVDHYIQPFNAQVQLTQGEPYYDILQYIGGYGYYVSHRLIPDLKALGSFYFNL
jgi:hypothetical protein